MKLRNAIGGVLRSSRVEQHRTLRDVSRCAKISLGYLSEVERGEKELSSELLASLCDALDVELADLLNEASKSIREDEERELARRRAAHHRLMLQNVRVAV